MIQFSTEQKYASNSLECGIESGISSNWEMPVIRIYAGESDYTKRQAIFDASFKYIGLPTDLYDNVITWLKGYQVICNDQIGGNPALCSYGGSAGDLPSLYIYASSIDVITIASNIYMMPKGNNYNLVFVRLSNTTNYDNNDT